MEKTSTIKKTLYKYVFWKGLDKRQFPVWSLLHRTHDGITTECGIKIYPQAIQHVGVRMMKRPPEHHTLGVCQVCISSVLKHDMNKE